MTSFSKPVVEFVKDHAVEIISVTAISFGYFAYRHFLVERPFRKLIAEKNENRNENFKQMEALLATKDEKVIQQRREILQMNFESLRDELFLDALQKDQLRPIEVLRAYQQSALLAQQNTNCVCEFLIEAETWAINLEKNFKGSDNKPSLYGIPLSVKESFKVNGHDSTWGLVEYIHDPADEDCELVRVLKDLGCVPFVLTNVPQTLMSIGSSNPVYGTATNPYSKLASCGGSSSGEGALIGSGGSILGIGGDIGGSVRVPAHCCGIFSLKPTNGRLSMAGNGNMLLGWSAVQPTFGPMGADVDSLVWFFRSIWTKKPMWRDPTVNPMPFQEDLLSGDANAKEGPYKTKLTIGYYDDDGYIDATPACKRAVRLAKDILESLGHKLVKFDVPKVADLMVLYANCVIPDSGYRLARMSSNLVDEHQRGTFCYSKMAMSFKRVLSYVFRPFSYHLYLKYGNFRGGRSNMMNVFDDLVRYKSGFIKLWQEKELDCVLCPVMASPALSPTAMADMFVYGWSYTALYNALDFPAGVVPCSSTDRSDPAGYSYSGGDHFGRLIKDDMSKFREVSLPVGVQFVALPFHDELCLRIMKEFETALRSRN